MARSVLSLVVCLACVLVVAPLLAVGQSTSTWYLCAILQASTYQSIDQAVLVVNSTSTTMSDYNGAQKPAYYVQSITSGSRTYTNLTVAGSQPVTVAMTRLAPVGSTGGNTNLIWPSTYPQMLNGDGLTFNFASPVSVAGQSASGTQMNLWWASGSNQLDEEVQGGTHETSPLQSTLTISQTQQPCTLPSYAQFSMCLIISGANYRTSISALLNTSGTAQPVSPSASNGLSSAAQGWTVTSVANGQRVYTPTSGSSTTSTLSGVASANAVASNDNYVFPDTGSSVFDAAGVGFSLSSSAPFADGSSASQLAIKYANGQYYEQTGSTTETSTSSAIAFQPFYQGTSLPPCAAIATQYTFFWSVNGTNGSTPLYSSVITGQLTVNPIAAGTASAPYWLITSLTGTRVFTDYSNAANSKTNTITALLSSGHIGGNDNRIYFCNSAKLLDGDGFSVQLDSVPPIYGQYNQANQTSTMNLWLESNTQYLEENLGGTHEQSPSSGSFIVTPVSGQAISSSTCSGTNNGGGGNNNHAAAAASFSGLSVLLAVTLLSLATQYALTA